MKPNSKPLILLPLSLRGVVAAASAATVAATAIAAGAAPQPARARAPHAASQSQSQSQSEAQPQSQSNAHGKTESGRIAANAAGAASSAVAAFSSRGPRPQATLVPGAATALTRLAPAAPRLNLNVLRITAPLAPLGEPATPKPLAEVAAGPAAAVAPVNAASALAAPSAAAPPAPSSPPPPSSTSVVTASSVTPSLVTRAAVAAAAVTANAAPDGGEAAARVRTAPVELSSRHGGDRAMLEQLQLELQNSEKRLSRADAELSEGQKQLADFDNVLSRAMLEAGADARGLNPFVKVAQHYAGTPYVWGGESRTGFDCSGFIIRVMRDLGYKALPHSAAEQFHYGLPIAQALLKPGDLVFFANTYKPGVSHVGIYLGRRRFIHAAGTGLGTIVSSLDTPKFQKKYAGARRLVKAGQRQD